MTFEIIEPQTEQEFERYYQFRWQVMRRPFQLPVGSEKDEFEQHAHHRMLLDAGGLPIAVGRLYQISCDEAQIRHMAVLESRRGQGIGSAMMLALEELAQRLGVKRLMLNARPEAIPFYRKHQYEETGVGPTHFGRIHHQQMLKNLQPQQENSRYADWCCELEKTWHDKIPISKQMGIRVVHYTGKHLEVRAAFNANVNLHGTLFAGSGYSLATLTAWGMVYMLLKEQGLTGNIVLSKADIEYLRPVELEPVAQAHRREVEGNLRPLRGNQSTRLKVPVCLMTEGKVAAHFQGEFVVLP